MKLWSSEQFQLALSKYVNANKKHVILVSGGSQRTYIVSQCFTKAEEYTEKCLLLDVKK